jgi:hypothetical protein
MISMIVLSARGCNGGAKHNMVVGTHVLTWHVSRVQELAQE